MPTEFIDRLLESGGPSLLDDIGDLGAALGIGIFLATIACGAATAGALRSLDEKGDLLPGISAAVGTVIGVSWLWRLSEGQDVSDIEAVALLVVPLGLPILIGGFGPPAHRTDIGFHWFRVVVLGLLCIYLIDVVWWTRQPSLGFSAEFVGAAKFLAAVELIHFAAALVSLVVAHLRWAHERWWPE